jgi:hypothetical protein
VLVVGAAVTIAIERITAETRSARALSISYIVPTIGRDSLARAIDSIDLWPGDELLIARSDTPAGGWGAYERNEALKVARCGWLAFLDDDDIFLPGARAAHALGIASAVRRHTIAPIIFKMRYSGTGNVVWKTPELCYGNVGTPMMLVPNDPEHLKPFSARHGQDWDFLEGSKWPRRVFHWRGEIVAEVVFNSRAASIFEGDAKRPS